MTATADQFVERAARELGYVETPNNRTQYAALAGHPNGYAWCATFIVAIARWCGVKLPWESAYTPYMADGFRKAGRFGSEPRKGAVAHFDFVDKVYRIQHVGIVESWTATTVTCIEGNTTKGTAGNQADGGGVRRRTRSRSTVVGYGYPEFAEVVTPAVWIVKAGSIEEKHLRSTAALYPEMATRAVRTIGPDDIRAAGNPADVSFGFPTDEGIWGARNYYLPTRYDTRKAIESELAVA